MVIAEIGADRSFIDIPSAWSVVDRLLTKNRLGQDAVAKTLAFISIFQRVQVSARVLRRSSGIDVRCGHLGCPRFGIRIPTGRIACEYAILSPDDALKHLRPVCGNRDAGLLRARGAEPVVHFGFRRSLPARLCLWLPAGSVAVWVSRGGVVGGRDTSMGIGRTHEMIGQCVFPKASTCSEVLPTSGDRCCRR